MPQPSCLHHTGCPADGSLTPTEINTLPWMPSSSFSFSPLMSVAVTLAPSFANACRWKTWVSFKQLQNVWICHGIKPAAQCSPCRKRNIFLSSCDSNKYVLIPECIMAVFFPQYDLVRGRYVFLLISSEIAAWMHSLHLTSGNNSGHGVDTRISLPHIYRHSTSISNRNPSTLNLHSKSLPADGVTAPLTAEQLASAKHSF